MENRTIPKHNQPDAVNPAISSLFAVGYHWRGITDAERSPFKHMRRYIALLLGTLILVPFYLSITTRAHTDSGVALLLVRSQFDEVVRLSVSSANATNFVLMSSVDLQEWEVMYQAFGWPGNDMVDWFGLNQPRRFWRAEPGESLERIEERWLAQEPAEYTFWFRHVLGFWEGEVRGIARVRDGSIIEVMDRVDALAEWMTVDPDAQFLTITEIFGKIRQEFEAGSQHIRVRYAPGGLYPEQVMIDRLLGVADDESLIEVADLVIVAP